MKERMKSLQKYLEVYRCVGTDMLDENELRARLKNQVSRSVLSDKVKEAFGGDAGMLVVRDNRVGIDFGEFRSFIEDLCHEFGTDAYVLFVGPVPAAKGRKCEEPQYARIEETKESPQTRQMRKENAELHRKVADLEKEIDRLKKVNMEKICQAVDGSMNKKVLILPSIRSFGPAVEEDIFLHDPAKMVDTSEAVSRHGGNRDSFYEVDHEKKHHLTISNVRNRIADALMRCSFFEKLFMDEEKAKAALQKSEQSREQMDDVIRENRKKSIELLLKDESLSNQAKLAFYAGWHEYHGTEMEDLLNFAGDHGLEADYVIRLLEKPEACHNYESIRGFLRQACKASEARIKREAARELISGEWYVAAEYNGRTCRFQMLPVEELLSFRDAIKNNMSEQAVFTLDKMLGTRRRAFFEGDNPEKDLVVQDTGFTELDENYYKKAAEMIHQYDEQREAEIHMPVDGDDCGDDFSEYEEEADGGQ